MTNVNPSTSRGGGSSQMKMKDMKNRALRQLDESKAPFVLLSRAVGLLTFVPILQERRLSRRLARLFLETACPVATTALFVVEMVHMTDQALRQPGKINLVFLVMACLQYLSVLSVVVMNCTVNVEPLRRVLEFFSYAEAVAGHETSAVIRGKVRLVVNLALTWISCHSALIALISFVDYLALVYWCLYAAAIFTGVLQFTAVASFVFWHVRDLNAQISAGRRLTTTRFHHAVLSQLTAEAVGVASVPLTLVLVGNLVSFLLVLYILVSHPVAQPALVSSLVFNVSVLGFVCVPAHLARREHVRTSALLAALPLSSTEDLAERSVFLQELAVTPVAFDLFGTVALDFRMVLNTVALLATYFVTLITFKPKLIPT